MHWRKLKVWQRAHELVLKCYRITATFPKTEVYGLVDQIKRAAYSVPSNIVEGQSRNTTKEYLTRIMQLLSLPKMRGGGCVDVLWYFKRPTTKQIR